MNGYSKIAIAALTDEKYKRFEIFFLILVKQFSNYSVSEVKNREMRKNFEFVEIALDKVQVRALERYGRGAFLKTDGRNFFRYEFKNLFSRMAL